MASLSLEGSLLASHRIGNAIDNHRLASPHRSIALPSLLGPRLAARQSKSGNDRFLVSASQSVTSPRPTAGVEADKDFDWDNLGFGLHATDAMYIAKCKKAGEWQKGEVLPYGDLQLSPAAGILNYAQGAFEGQKAYRTADGRILLFRPDENAQRLQRSADRMCMLAPSQEEFIAGVEACVRANLRWVPPAGKGSLYIRSLLFGSGPVLGLAPAPEFTFMVYVSPVGNYFKGTTLTPIHLVVEESCHRAAPGGMGGAKAVGNYAQVLQVQMKAKKEGFSDVLFLDVTNKYIEEVSSCNIFVVKGKTISTPALVGTILPGITRKSILQLAADRGYQVEERFISVPELLEADEVFCTGTAVVGTPVGSVTYQGQRYEFGDGKCGPVLEELYAQLTGLQMGQIEDKLGWTVQIA